MKLHSKSYSILACNFGIKSNERFMFNPYLNDVFFVNLQYYYFSILNSKME